VLVIDPRNDGIWNPHLTAVLTVYFFVHYDVGLQLDRGSCGDVPSGISEHDKCVSTVTNSTQSVLEISPRHDPPLCIFRRDWRKSPNGLIYT